MQQERAGNSASIPLKPFESLTFRDWWHLLARYTSVVESKDTVRTALKIIAHRGFRHLPVVSDGNLVGVVSTNTGYSSITASEMKFIAARLISSLDNPVSTIMNSHPVTVNPGETILDAIRLIGEKNIGSLLIVEGKDRKNILRGTPENVQKTAGEKLLGIVSLRDIVSILAAYSPFGARIEDYMTGRVTTMKETDSIYSAMTLMAKERVRRLPVMTATTNMEDGGSVLGMVTNKMILRYLESIISYEMLDMKFAISQPVKILMLPRMPLIDPKEDCGNAAYLMRELGTGGFAVVDSRGLVGVITERDLIRRVYQKGGLSFFSELFEKGNARMQI